MFNTFMMTKGRPRVILYAGLAAALFTATASATVVGTVNITSGAQASVQASGISIVFNNTCLTPTPTGAALFGGCVGAEVDTLGNGTLGTPAGPLESTVNGVPPIASAVFIANVSTATSFPVAPFMQFTNSAGTAVGITVSSLSTAASTFGPSAETDCGNIGFNGVCSIYQGAIITLQNKGAAGTNVSVSFSGQACDGTATNCATPSPFNGSFTTQVTTIPGVTGSGPNGVILPVDIQKYFGCPTTTTNLTIGSCTALQNTITSSQSGTFFATVGSSVPEPESLALTMIGSCLIGFGAWRRRKKA